MDEMRWCEMMGSGCRRRGPARRAASEPGRAEGQSRALQCGQIKSKRNGDGGGERLNGLGDGEASQPFLFVGLFCCLFLLLYLCWFTFAGLFLLDYFCWFVLLACLLGCFWCFRVLVMRFLGQESVRFDQRKRERPAGKL